MKKWLWVASSCMVFSLVGIGLVGTAAACTWDVGSPFLAGNPQQDEPPVEATFPDAVHLAVRQVTRDPELGPEDSCGSVGVVQIGVSFEETEDYGLVWKVVEGEHPQFFSLSNGIVLYPDRNFHLLWRENREDLPKAYEFQVTATWVDAWGREGNESEPLLIQVPAADSTLSQGSSCSHVAGSRPGQSTLVWIGVGVMLLRVRRKVF